MFLLLIIPILISGFYICNHNLYYFYRLHRYEGQYLYLKSALLGFTCLIIASFLSLLFNKFIPLDAITFIDSLITSAINDPIEKSKIMLMSSILRDSPLDNILLKSYINESPLMLTLNDRKVYVGIVSSLGEPNVI